MLDIRARKPSDVTTEREPMELYVVPPGEEIPVELPYDLVAEASDHWILIAVRPTGKVEAVLHTPSATEAYDLFRNNVKYPDTVPHWDAEDPANPGHHTMRATTKLMYAWLDERNAAAQ